MRVLMTWRDSAGEMHQEVRTVPEDGDPIAMPADAPKGVSITEYDGPPDDALPSPR